MTDQITRYAEAAFVLLVTGAALTAGAVAVADVASAQGGRGGAGAATTPERAWRSDSVTAAAPVPIEETIPNPVTTTRRIVVLAFLVLSDLSPRYPRSWVSGYSAGAALVSWPPNRPTRISVAV